MGTKVREIAWPDEYGDLKRIEELMICGICYEYIDTSVITPCSHNYCSVCIRKYLHYKAQCPACFHVFFEKDLYINRTMDGLIQHYIKVREKLISLIENRVVYNTIMQREENPVSSSPIRPPRNSQLPESPKIVEKKQSEPNTPKINLAIASTSKCNISSPTGSRSPKVIPSIAKIFSTPKRKEVAPLAVNVKTVSCPVCSVDISENHINVHLDACLKREVSQQTQITTTKVPKMPPLPKLVLRVMKDAELRKKIKELGLSTQGDRRTLESRFTRYSVIYNAECDKLEPRPISELIRQCEMEEKQERKMDSFLVSTATTNRLQIERNAEGGKIEEAQKNYRMANKSSFDKLVKEIKNRKRVEKANQHNNNIASSDSISEPSISTDSQNTKSILEEVPESIVKKECDIDNHSSTSSTFQNVDFDSDESCPLQHYKSDDPISVLQNCNDSNSSFLGSPIKNVQSINKNSKPKNVEILEKNTKNPYEMTTDESSNEDISSSPILHTNPIRKRVKLSHKSLIFESPKPSTSNTSSYKDLKEEGDEKTAARELCNSIIKDFSFDLPSDDSSNEFIDKPQSSMEDIKGMGKNKLVKENNTINFSDISVPIKNVYTGNLLNGLSNSLADVSFEISSDVSFNEIVNTSILDPNEVQEQIINRTSKESININGTRTEKENNFSNANDNLQPSCSEGNEGTIRRPVRKRNRPSRFTDDEFAKQNEKEKTLKNLSEDLQDDGQQNDTKTNVLPDGPLKRRRGRSKACSIEQPLGEIENPPKRPIRRRQLASNRNNC